MSSLRLHLILTLSLGVLTGACSHIAYKMPFKASSSDHNKNKAQQVTLKGGNIADEAAKIKSIMTRYNIQLVSEAGCEKQGPCMLEFSVVNKNQSWTYFETKTDNRSMTSFSFERTLEVSHKSVYFVRLTPLKQGIQALFIGLPAINDVMSCPDFVKKYIKPCEPFGLIPGFNDDPYGGYYEEFKLDFSGRIEFHLLKRIINDYNGNPSPSEDTKSDMI